jgi:peptidoglycan/xylan/chitin deacetylase (PgdA/CDA1 family)
LEQKHATASFFLVGSKIGGNQTLVQRMAADSFEVGNHSWDHPNMTGLTPAQVRDELLSTQTVIVNAGAPLPTLFRPPYGAVSEQVLADAGLQAALWNIDPDDWRATDPAALAQAIVATAKPGGIIDLHDIHQVTADALPTVIDQLAAQGYKFVTVSELLHSRERPGHDPFYGYAATPPPLVQ